MAIVVREDRSKPRALIVVVLLLVVFGIAAFLLMRSRDTPDDTRKLNAEPKPTSDARLPSYDAPKAPTSDASGVSVAIAASSNARHPEKPWQQSLQPVVVAATRAESLAAYQVQMEGWSCKDNVCTGNFRIPPNVVDGQKMSAVSDLFASLKKQMGEADMDVYLSSAQPGPQGMAVSLAFSPTASIQGRYYTPGEIAAIRLESFEQGRKASGQSVQGSK